MATTDASASTVREELEPLAEQILSYFRDAVDAAEAKLANPSQGLTVHSLASVNTLTSSTAQSFNAVSENLRRALESAVCCPAIARVEVLNEAGNREVLFITPGGAPLPRIGELRTASYLSPAGRLAAIPVGAELRIRGGPGIKTYELLSRERLAPERRYDGWDSKNTIVERDQAAPWTVVSLRALLRAAIQGDDGMALLDMLLSGDEAETNVFEGIRRAIRTKIELRQQHSLDPFQDEIFRLPLQSQIAILGPPGSGKTTTLVKRLGQKLDRQSLDDEEAASVAKAYAGMNGHSNSWLMFSPTELLRLYVKEAFNRAGIAAPDGQVLHWDSYRFKTSRNQLSILGTSAGRGFVLRDQLNSIQPSTLNDLVSWFEDFDGWQRETFWTEMLDHALRVASSDEPRLKAVAPALVRSVEYALKTDASSVFQDLQSQARQLGDLANELRKETDKTLRRAFARLLATNPKLMDDLGAFLATLGRAADPTDEPEEGDDDDDELPPPRTPREETFNAYVRTMRAVARASISGRLRPRSRNGQIAAWLGDRVPDEAMLRRVGASILMSSSLRSLTGSPRLFLRRMPSRYRRYRRERAVEGRWYKAGGFGPLEISPLELDVVMLATLRGARSMLRDNAIAASVNEPAYASLRSVRDLFRSQVLVDEVTDFSPIQLACMAALCDPATDSLCVCGDFNQRVTAWGLRRISDLRWVSNDFDVRPISVTYRHSRQLNQLAHRLASLSDEKSDEAVLPQHVNNEGVDPVLGIGLSGHSLSTWLAARIAEIEALVAPLPSVAILANGEAAAQLIADGLNKQLERSNLRCSACVDGKVKGDEGDVRVYNVQHIKGLEFEAVFFVGVDTLADAKPDLFDKFLYVGATRAAMYLGVTTEGDRLPARMQGLAASFCKDWSK